MSKGSSEITNSWPPVKIDTPHLHKEPITVQRIYPAELDEKSPDELRQLLFNQVDKTDALKELNPPTFKQGENYVIQRWRSNSKPEDAQQIGFWANTNWASLTKERTMENAQAAEKAGHKIRVLEILYETPEQ